MQVADRRCFFNDTRIVVVHTVDVCPYLNFFRTDSRADQRGAVVAASTLQVVDLSVSVSADIALCDEEVCILMFVQQLNELFFNVHGIRLGVLVRTHVIQCRNQNRVDAAFVQVEVHHAGGDQFALSQDNLFFEQCEKVFRKRADMVEMMFYQFFGFLLIFVGAVELFNMAVIFLSQFIDDLVCSVRVFLVQVIRDFDQ